MSTAQEMNPYLRRRSAASSAGVAPGSDGGMGSVAPIPAIHQRRQRPPLTTRSVISIFSILTVLIVGITTFTISYTSTLSIVDSIGRQYATAVVLAGRNDVEGYFDRASRNIKALALHGKEAWNVVPTHDPSPSGLAVVERMNDLQLQALLTDADQAQTITTIWDDGSVASVFVGYEPGIASLHAVNAADIPVGQRCCSSRGSSGERFISNMSEPTPYRGRVYPFADGRFDGYDGMRSLVEFASFGLWLSVGIYEQQTRTGTVRSFMLNVIHPIQNHTNHYIAFVGVGIQLAALDRMASDLEATANSQVFVFDGVPALVATSHPANFTVFTPSTSRNPALEPNCATSAFFADEGVTDHIIACRSRPENFDAFPPLVALAKAEPSAVKLSPGDRLVTKINEAEGGVYYAASVGLRNTERNFAMTLLLMMPEEDILGDVVRTRNTVIGIVAAVCIVCAALSALIVTLILAPLSEVSRRMRRTARLTEDTGRLHDADDFSMLAEIHDLQDAYATMNTAITSFTRYVPRDVVKDLMDSGELCEIKMQPRLCTTLFVDIAGFTSMCERVPPQELSGLVETYFERMSALVMGHDGLIDKYIGDSIMAVWGAPFETPNPELKATLTALALDRETRVNPLADVFDAAGEVLRVRVGVSSGSVLAGNMGSSERMNYTVIGDPVNLAARLESLNKQFGTHVMLDEATAQVVAPLVKLRLLLAIQVVGKEIAANVYEPVGLRADRAPEALDSVRSNDREAEQAAKQLAQADNVSVLSARSSVAGGNNSNSAASRTRTRLDTAQMIDNMARLSDAPLHATEAQCKLADAHTAAVRLMMQADFAGAIAACSDVARMAQAVCNDEPDLPWAQNRVPAEKLSSMCESFLSDPPGDTFNGGVWRTADK